ncbi:O-antigen ligase family protein, partial [Aminipila sp.]|uniref:O-antigen ligase family protein n=1 Tax=Aminipila sp. TaxID=2060095 RepID=UPI0028A15091
AIFTVLLILSTAMMGSFDLMVQKWTAFLCLCAIIILMFIPQAKNAFQKYTTPLFIVTIGYIIWNGISVFYADVPKAALFEFTKLIAAATAFFAVLIFTEATKKGVKVIFTAISVTTAFFGLISIDAASNGPIATIFKVFMGLFTNKMAYWGVFENGIRITGIFGNANTFSGFMAMGILISLSLVLNSYSKKERAISLILLAVNALSYILLFSLGSLFMFFIACILMIAFSEKGKRLTTFILMAETAIITLIFTGVSLATLGSSPIVPFIAVILNALALWAADNYIRKPISDKIASNVKGSLVTSTIIIILIIGYLIAALDITGPLTLTANDTVMRATYLETGKYKLTSVIDSKSSDDTSLPKVRIVTQNMTDLKVHTSTELYNGLLKDAQFTVPDDSEIIKLYFTSGSAAEGTLKQVIYEAFDKDTVSGNTTGSIKLNYKLLPAIAANRIQDLKANENAIQRMVFFEDGMKLFKQSPIIGNGLSGYETGVASVQNFFYENRYVHNHYIQVLCDLGIIGFTFFIGILILCIVSLANLFKQSKAAGYKNASSFALPVMVACIFQMFGQAITDLTWSAGPFLLIAFGIIALLIVVDSKLFTASNTDAPEFSSLTADHTDVFSPSKGKAVLTGDMFSRVGIIALTALMTVLIGLNLYAHYRAASGNCTMDQIAALTKIDKFESDDYKTTYIVTTSTYGLEENLNQANEFAQELTKNPDAVLNYVLPYYFNTGQDDKLFETASAAAYNGKSDPETWNRLFEIFNTAIDANRDNPTPVLMHLFENKEYYIGGLLGYYKDLQQRNTAYLDEAMLSSENVAFIGKLLGIEKLDKTNIIEALDVFVKTIFDSQYAVDANNDGVPDNISVLSGSTTWGQTAASKEKNTVAGGFNSTMKASAGTVMEMATYCVRGGEYTVRLSGLSGLEGNAFPKDIAAAIDGQPVSVQYDQDGAFIKVRLKGAVPADEANKIQATAASTEKIVITFPTGAQMTKVTIKK